MDLIIVGNGFDLAHNLPTSYGDFKDFLKVNDSSAISSLEFFFPRLTDKKDDYLLWSDFEEALIFPNEEEIKFLDSTIEQTDSYNSLFALINHVFYKWVRDISYYGVKQKELIGKCIFANYLKNDNLFLSFNYTETLEEYYGITNVLHIHGCAAYNGRETNSSIIFGHRPVITSLSVVALTEKNVHDVINQHIKWFKNLPSFVDGTIVVFGFSYSRSDYLYFQYIRNYLPDRRWIFYYHNQDDKIRMQEYIKCLCLNEHEYKIIES